MIPQPQPQSQPTVSTVGVASHANDKALSNINAGLSGMLVTLIIASLVIVGVIGAVMYFRQSGSMRGY
jgi:hypothetical protein